MQRTWSGALVNGGRVDLRERPSGLHDVARVWLAMATAGDA